MCRNSKRIKYSISGIILIVIFAVMFFSSFSIEKEAIYEDTKADCPICNEIQACSQTLKTMDFNIISGLVLVSMLFYSALIVTIAKSIHVIVNTLVSLKVKLTN